MNVYEKLSQIQTQLKVPKTHYNEFGNYYFRNCEDILDAVKPLAEKVKSVVYLSDDMIYIGDRYYVKATAVFVDLESCEKVIVTANAREEQEKKKYDGSQLTGSSSSYARKYALNGLFAIDDTKDADTTNNGKEDAIDWKTYFVKLCKEKNIVLSDYATQKGIDKQTTQEEFKRLCEELRRI